MKRIVGCFKVGRNDPILLSVVVLTLFAIALPVTFDLQEFGQRNAQGTFFTVLGGLAGTLFSLALILGSPNSYRASDRKFALGGSLLMLAALFWSMRMLGSVDPELVGFQFFGIFQSYWMGWRGFLLLWGGFLAAALTFWIGQKIFDLLSQKLKGFDFDRSRVLVVIAGLLFVAAVIRNIVSSFPTHPRMLLGEGGLLDQVVVSLGVLFGVIIPGIWVSRITSIFRRLLGVICLIALFAGLGLAYVVSNVYNPRWILTSLVVFSFAFSLPLVLVRPDRRFANRADGKKSASETPVRAGTSHKVWNPMWSGTALFVLLASIICVYRYDIKTLFTMQTDRWEAARKMRVLSSDSTAEFSGASFDVGSHFAIRTNQETPADYFDKFRDVGTPVAFVLQDLNTSIDCNPISDTRPNSVVVMNSRISPQQLEDLARNTRHLSTYNVQMNLNDSEGFEPVAPKVSGAWHIADDRRPGQVALMLKAVNDFSQIGGISINNVKINLEDWEQVVRAATQCQLDIGHVQFEEGVLDRWHPQSGQTLKELVVYFDRKQRQEALKLLLKSDAQVRYRDAIFLRDRETFWSLVLLAGNQFSDTKLGYRILSRNRPSTGEEVRDRFEKFDWVLASSDGVAESVYFPGCFDRVLNDLVNFSSLKRLSLDTRWVNEEAGINFKASSVDLGTLGVLTQLEELYLPADAESEGLGFLSKLTQLKKLQIATTRFRLGQTGFEKCQSLKSLTLLNSPSNKTLAEIKSIKTLEELTIVDFGYRFNGAGSIAKLEAQFPNVKISIVDPVNYRANVTQEFRDHCARVRQRKLTSLNQKN